jgi:sugar phosphate isomerase/epimerase
MIWGITCFFENKADLKIVEKLAPVYPLSFLEIRGERPFFSPEDISGKDVRFFRDILDKTGLRVTLHATFYDINLSTINSYLRRAVLDCYREYLNLAEQLNVEIMVLHGGHIIKDAVGIQQIEQQAEQNLIENLKNLGDMAARKNIVIGLENSPPGPHPRLVHDWISHIRILEKVRHEQVRAVLDTAHAHLQDLDLNQYFREIEKYLVELHVHNNDGKEDSHAALNHGTIDYAHFFSENRVEVPVILEIKTYQEAIESLEWIKKYEQ